MLSPETLDLLRQWWKARPPDYDATTPLQERWLFPGRTPGKPMITRQLSRLFHEAAGAAGIKKSVTLHVLRHSFAATALLSLAPAFLTRLHCRHRFVDAAPSVIEFAIARSGIPHGGGVPKR